MNSKELKRKQDPKNRSIIKDEIKSSNTPIKKTKKPQVVHYQTHLMAKQFMTYCGRRNITTSVKTTFNKSEVTCYHCLKYLNMI